MCRPRPTRSGRRTTASTSSRSGRSTPPGTYRLLPPTGGRSSRTRARTTRSAAPSPACSTRGAAQPIDVAFNNPNAGNGGSGVNGVRVAKPDGGDHCVRGPTSPRHALPGRDWRPTSSLVQFSGAYPFYIPQGTSSLSTLVPAIPSCQWPSIRLINKPASTRTAARARRSTSPTRGHPDVGGAHHEHAPLRFQRERERAMRRLLPWLRRSSATVFPAIEHEPVPDDVRPLFRAVLDERRRRETEGRHPVPGTRARGGRSKPDQPVLGEEKPQRARRRQPRARPHLGHSGRASAPCYASLHFDCRRRASDSSQGCTLPGCD